LPESCVQNRNAGLANTINRWPAKWPVAVRARRTVAGRSGSIYAALWATNSSASAEAGTSSRTSAGTGPGSHAETRAGTCPAAHGGSTPTRRPLGKLVNFGTLFGR
jgi:hypothetical protein